MRAIFTMAIPVILLGLTTCRKAGTGPTRQCSLSVPDSSTAHPKNADFESILRTFTRRGLPGISVLVEDENGVWFGSAGKADLKKNITFEPCNVSKAASITKMMVATLAYMLEEEGLVDLDDPLADHIDGDLIDKVENAADVSIRDCMHHTTGIYDIINDSEFYLAVLNHPDKNWKSDELIRYAYGREADFPPNSDAAYSNTNYLLVSMALDEVLGYHHSHALRQKLWDPLDMNDTYYQSRESLPGNTAQGYYDLYNDGSIVNVSNFITGSGNGYGGVFSTVFDLRKFMRALYFEKQLISEANLLLMQDFVRVDGELEVGAGMLRRFGHFAEHPGVGHSGRDLGYSADLFAFPGKNDRLMISFVNYGTDGETELKEVFLDFEEALIEKILE